MNKEEDVKGGYNVAITKVMFDRMEGVPGKPAFLGAWRLADDGLITVGELSGIIVDLSDGIKVVVDIDQMAPVDSCILSRYALMVEMMLRMSL